MSDDEREKRAKRAAYVREWRKKARSDPEYYKKEKEYERKRMMNPELRERKNEQRRRKYKECKEYRAKKDAYKRIRYNFNTKVRLRHYKYEAAKKKRQFSITDDEAVALFTDKCYYCGGKDGDALSGIDRKDYRGGYTPDNILSCCKKCNMMKVKLLPEDYIEQCRRVAARHPVAAPTE